MPIRKTIVAAIALLASVWALPVRAADLIVVNAKIIRDGLPAASALAVADGRFVGVGAERDIMALRHPATRVIDAEGRTIIPGLVDSHIHAIRAGLSFASEASFIGARSIKEAMDRLAAQARAIRPDGWIVVAGGWTPQQFTENRVPSLAEVRAAAPGRPVYLQLFYRAALLTPEAVALLGLERKGLPAGALAQTDGEGNATGWISGSAKAIARLYESLPKGDTKARMASTRAFFAALNALGVTGVIDPGGHNIGPDDYEAVFGLWRRRELSLRVAYSICAPSAGKELAEYQAYTRFLPSGWGDDWLRFNGIGERVTWGLYNNNAPSPGQIRQFEDIALWAARAGHTLTVHWNKDVSAGVLLDIFSRVNARVPIAPLRWSVAHLHDTRPETLERMKHLGLGWLTQNSLYFAREDYLAALPSGRRGSAPPLVSALRLGLPTGAGTDGHRVMDYNPFVALQWMLDGKTVDGRPTRGVEETPGRIEALRLWTKGGAWFTFDEKRRGGIVPGMLADFAVLSKDYWSLPVAEIGTIESLLTVVGGRSVHAAGPFR